MNLPPSTPFAAPHRRSAALIVPTAHRPRWSFGRRPPRHPWCGLAIALGILAAAPIATCGEASAQVQGDPVQADPVQADPVQAERTGAKLVDSPPLPIGRWGEAFGGDGADAAATDAASDEQARLLQSIQRAASSEDTIAGIEEQLGDRFDHFAGLVASLGSGDFAERERASNELIRGGAAPIPLLNHCMKQTDDPEVRLRIGELLRELSARYREELKAAFLSGRRSDVPGWAVARRMLGDSVETRELYVRISQDHLPLAMSLEADTQTRQNEVERGVAALRAGMYEGRVPTKADMVAVLLPAGDPQFRTTPGMESSMLSLYATMAVASELNRSPDSRTYGPNLSAGFVLRTLPQNRADWLLKGTMLALPQMDELAIQTLAEFDDPVVTCVAMASLVRYDRVDQIPELAPRMDDQRVVPAAQVFHDELLELRVGDVAMAAVGALAGQSTLELGFLEDANHPNVGLIIDRLGFAADDAADRRGQVRTKVDALLTQWSAAAAATRSP